MSLSKQTYYIEHIELILICGLVGFILNRIALQKNFYKLPASLSFVQTKLSFIHVVLCFAIYLINSIVLAPLFLRKFHPHATFAAAAWIQVLALFISAFLLCGFCKITLKTSFTKILRDRPKSISIFQDILFGIITWALAFPVVAVVEQCADVLVYALFGIETYEQIAVHYLKMALESPLTLTAALAMVLVAAPFLEELLFRGLLQTWIKKHLGLKASILITSLCFALFHVSESHGAGNFSLIPSLFVFSCFLGFIYERQKSLFASIILHTTFNLVSTLRIIFTMDSL